MNLPVTERKELRDIAVSFSLLLKKPARGLSKGGFRLSGCDLPLSFADSSPSSFSFGPKPSDSAAKVFDFDTKPSGSASKPSQLVPKRFSSEPEGSGLASKPFGFDVKPFDFELAAFDTFRKGFNSVPKRCGFEPGSYR